MKSWALCWHLQDKTRQDMDTTEWVQQKAKKVQKGLDYL